jgi:broad specificity phosphatase PhoE
VTAGRSGTVHLVRHAKAGSRKRFTGRDDRLRPLSEEGARQAELIADRFLDPAAPVPVDLVVSSPLQRCVETVQPLARRLRLELELVDELGEGADPLLALRRLVELAKGGRQVVACSHGDVIYGLLEIAVDAGILGGSLACPKGATWALALSNGQITGAAYVPPPLAGPM